MNKKAPLRQKYFQTENLRKGAIFMKKISLAVIISVLVFSFVFAACNGTDSGKVSDTHRTDPMLTELEDMVTEVMTDIEDMMPDDVTDGFSDMGTNVTQ